MVTHAWDPSKKLRRETQYKFEVSLGYTVASRERERERARTCIAALPKSLIATQTHSLSWKAQHQGARNDSDRVCWVYIFGHRQQIYRKLDQR